MNFFSWAISDLNRNLDSNQVVPGWRCLLDAGDDLVHPSGKGSDGRSELGLRRGHAILSGGELVVHLGLGLEERGESSGEVAHPGLGNRVGEGLLEVTIDGVSRHIATMMIPARPQWSRPE